jgi:hypothetical protein
MKITRGELKALIREERKRSLEEGVFSAMQILSSDKAIEPIADAIYGSLKSVLENELRMRKGAIGTVMAPIKTLLRDASSRALERLAEEHEVDADASIKPILDPRPKMKSHPPPATSMQDIRDQESLKNWYPLEEGDEG